MTDSSKDPLGDPFDLLRAHVRVVALLEQPAVDADELVADITGSIDRADRSRGAQVLPLHGFPSARSPRRRRWFVAGSVATIVAVGGAGVAAYVALRPSDPVAGIVCRESADPNSYSVVLPLEGDPVAACTNLWKTGDLPNPERGEANGEIPELVACEGGQGAIEVLPVGAVGSCEYVGLVPSGDRSPAEDAVGVLRERVAEHLSGGCRSAADLRDFIEEQLMSLGLTSWEINLLASEGDCALASIESERQQILVIEDPLAPPPPEEKP